MFSFRESLSLHGLIKNIQISKLLFDTIFKFKFRTRTETSARGHATPSALSSNRAPPGIIAHFAVSEKRGKKNGLFWGGLGEAKKSKL